MARDHAQLKTRAWADPDFRALHVHAQWLYFAALSQPLLSYCGVVAYTPDGFADLADGLTVAHVRKAARLLEDRDYVLTDARTAEMWCRTFIRHDGLLKQPNLVRAATNAHATIRSASIRDAVVKEVRRTAGLASADDRTRAGARELYRQLTGRTLGEGSAGPHPRGSGEPTPPGSGEGPRDATRATPSPTPSTPTSGPVDPPPPETLQPSNSQSGGDSDDPFLAAVGRARKRAGRDMTGWTWPAIRQAIDRAIANDRVGRAENARDLVVALAADAKTDLPARLDTDAGVAVARAILADQRRDQARARTEAHQREGAAEAERKAEADLERRKRAVRRLEGLPDEQREQLVAEAEAHVRDTTGGLTPAALVQLRIADLLDRQETSA